MAKVPYPPSKGKSAIKKPAKRAVKAVSGGLVDFSFQDVAYQIDLDKSKVYRRFIEVEKSRQGTIITAYRTGAARPTL